MQRIFKHLFAAVILMGFAFTALHCGPPPKPKELLRLEAMRTAAYAQKVKDRSPQLFQESDSHYRKAVESWDSSDMELCREQTMLSTFKFKAAEAISRRMDADERLTNANTRIKTATEKYDSQRLSWEATSAKLDLYRAKSVLAETEAEKNSKLAALQRVMDVKNRVSRVELDIQKAESMNAALYAAGPLSQAKVALNSAKEQLTAEQTDEAEKFVVDAEKAVKSALAISEAPARKSAFEAQSVTILKAAAAVSNTESRIDQRGVVVTISMVFKKRKNEIDRTKQYELDKTAELIQQFAAYPIRIEAHTHTKTKNDLALSQSQAQAVKDYLVSKGCDAKRFEVVGQGGKNNVSQSWKINNRVEIIFTAP